MPLGYPVKTSHLCDTITDQPPMSQQCLTSASSGPSSCGLSFCLSPIWPFLASSHSFLSRAYFCFGSVFLKSRKWRLQLGHIKVEAGFPAEDRQAGPNLQMLHCYSCIDLAAEWGLRSQLGDMYLFALTRACGWDHMCVKVMQ